jgi:thioesterase domain-containing protein
MTTVELLARLRARDARLWIEQDRLRCSAPTGALSAELKAAMATRKDEIIALLRHAEALKHGWSAIVPLKAEGRRPPLFAIPGHNGDVFCYRPLAGHLDPDQPLLGVQPPGLDGGDLFRSIDELARHAVRQIRQHRPYGPYLIAGYCTGGTVAFEVARQLVAQGQQVPLLAIFGSPYPPLYRWRSLARIRAGELAARARRHLRALTSGSLADAAAYIKRRARRRQDERAVHAEQLHNPARQNRRRVERATTAAVRRYHVRPYPGRIDYFLPSEAARFLGGLPQQWQAAAGSLREHVGPDDCALAVMLREPHVAGMAEELCPLLSEACRDAGERASDTGSGLALDEESRPEPPRAFSRRRARQAIEGWAASRLDGLNRVHLFEFNDQRWLPRFMTGWMTRVLRVGHEATEDGRVWAPKVLELIERYGQAEIVDLCSGGGGPVLGMTEILEREHGVSAHVTLTDFIPNLQTAREINEARADRVYVTQPISATDVPAHLKGVRTVFSGLHHLKPELAFCLLKNAYDCRQHIFIGETTTRSLPAIRTYWGAVKYFFSMTRQISPTAAQRFFTFALPVLPLMLGWDNVVSCLRTYSRAELTGFLGQLQSDDYHWEVGELWNPVSRMPYPYVMGYPVTR